MVNGIISISSTNNVIKLQTSGYSITTDKKQYNYGENIYWKAEGLIKGKRYVVGVLYPKENKFFWAPSRDEFTATETSKSGSYFVGTNLPPGDAEFALCEKSDNELFFLTSTPIKIGGFDLITWLMQNWWILAIIGFILLIIFLLK